MIAAIDIGNSYITIGCMEGSDPVFLTRINTDPEKTDFEYTIDLYNAFRLKNISPSEVTGGILSCVVPSLLTVMKSSMERVFSFTPVVVSADSKGLPKILLDHPRELGSNLIADAAAAIYHYPAPIILIDMGMATSVGVIDENGDYSGGVILPGLQSSVDELSGGTSALPFINVSAPLSTMPTTTIDAMTSGVIFGNAGMLDAMIDRIQAELSSPATLIATGHLSTLVMPYLKHKVTVDEFLPLKGLSLIYKAEQEGLS